MAALVQLVTRKPRTCPELAKLLGSRHETVSAMLGHLAAEGLVDVSSTVAEGSRGQTSRLYTWVPAP